MADDQTADREAVPDATMWDVVGELRRLGLTPRDIPATMSSSTGGNRDVLNHNALHNIQLLAEQQQRQVEAGERQLMAAEDRPQAAAGEQRVVWAEG